MPFGVTDLRLYDRLYDKQNTGGDEIDKNNTLEDQDMIFCDLRWYTDNVFMELLAVMPRVMLILFRMPHQKVRKVLYHLYVIKLSSEVLKGLVEFHAVSFSKHIAVEVPLIALTTHEL